MRPCLFHEKKQVNILDSEPFNGWYLFKFNFSFGMCLNCRALYIIYHYRVHMHAVPPDILKETRRDHKFNQLHVFWLILVIIPWIIDYWVLCDKLWVTDITATILRLINDHKQADAEIKSHYQKLPEDFMGHLISSC